jgi:hypothetical protein
MRSAGRLGLVVAATAGLLAACGDAALVRDGGSADAAKARDGAMGDEPVAGADAGTDPTPAHDAAVDASTALPDLVAITVIRTANYYRLRYCNQGAGAGNGLFRVRLERPANGESFETGRLYEVPAAGKCAESGNVTCGLIGDVGCVLAGDVIGTVDSGMDIAETDEDNNSVVVSF